MTLAEVEERLRQMLAAVGFVQLGDSVYLEEDLDESQVEDLITEIEKLRGDIERARLCGDGG